MIDSSSMEPVQDVVEMSVEQRIKALEMKLGPNVKLTIDDKERLRAIFEEGNN